MSENDDVEVSSATVTHIWRKTPGLKDVAARAGVSLATVSGILNGSKSNTKVSDTTRQRVLCAASELQYRPNAVARALVGRMTRTIGVLFGVPAVTVDNVIVFTLLRGIAGGASAFGYNIMLFTDPWIDKDHSLTLACDGRTDGLAALSVPDASDLIPSLSEAGVPLVAISSSAGRYGIPSVDVDNVAGARLATEHLLSLGHRRIAHIVGDSDIDYARIRKDTFCSTMAAAGHSVPTEYVTGRLTSFKETYDQARRLLALDHPPTAIFAATDDMAYIVLSAAADAGIRVPQDLSVIGFDDVSVPMTFTPALTTIRQPMVKIGEVAAQTLIRLIKGETLSTKPMLFAPELVVRNTTAGTIASLLSRRSEQEGDKISR